MLAKLARTIATRCNGCGVTIQTAHPTSSGYIPLHKLEEHFKCRENYQYSIKALLKNQLPPHQLTYHTPDTIQEIENVDNKYTISTEEFMNHKKIINKRTIYCNECKILRTDPLCTSIKRERKAAHTIDTDVAITAIFNNIKTGSLIIYVVVLLFV